MLYTINLYVYPSFPPAASAVNVTVLSASVFDAVIVNGFSTIPVAGISVTSVFASHTVQWWLLLPGVVSVASTSTVHSVLKLCPFAGIVSVYVFLSHVPVVDVHVYVSTPASVHVACFVIFDSYLCVCVVSDVPDGVYII